MSLQFADFESYVASLPSSMVAWNELYARTESIQRPPSFVLGTLPVGLSLPLLSEFLTGPIRLYALKNACVTLDGIIIHENTALSSIMFNHPDYHVEELINRTLGGSLSLPVRLIKGQAVMLSGPGYNIYGHWLADILPRLWILYRSGYEPSNVRYIVPLQAPAFLEPLLETFGIGPHQLLRYDERAEFLQIEELLLATNMRRASRLHASMAQARDYLVSRVSARAVITVPGSGLTRVFISRRMADPSRNLQNRARIEEIANSEGFVSIHPEDMTVLQQIGFFSQVTAVVGEYGSGLHNTLFSPAGIAVCALRGTSAHPGFIQSSISHICRQHTGYVLAETPIEAIHQSFEVPEQLFRIALKCVDLLSRADSE